MTMLKRDLSEMPEETALLGEKIWKATHPYRVIGDHLVDIVKDEQFEDMYDLETGRHALSPALLAMITIFQFQESLPDREAAEMVAARLDWKYALHLPLDYEGFHYSCLCYFRQRLLAHDKDALVFEAILNKVKSLGFIKRKGKQRTDSTAVIGAVRELSRLEMVTETLRVAVKAITKADQAWAKRGLPASFRETYVETRPDYRLTEREREDALRNVGQDGLWLLEQLEKVKSEGVRKTAEVDVLRKVWHQQYEQVDGIAKPKKGQVNCRELIVSPHDPGVRIGQKRGKGWIGEKVHVTETAERGDAHFITDVATENSSSADVEALRGIRERESQREVLPGEQYVDAGYVSGKELADSQKAGIELLGPALSDTSQKEFKLADFPYDEERRGFVCPAGELSVGSSWRPLHDGSIALHVKFKARTCANCTMRSRCTDSKQGRTLQISEHHQLVMQRRVEAQTTEFREKMKTRAAVEGTISELVRKHGLRRHRYRGEDKRRMENLFKAAACNLKRLVRAMIAREVAASGVYRMREMAVAL